MKRIWSIVLAAVLAAGLMLSGAAAAGGMTLALSPASGRAGDTVTLTVTVDNNPGMATCLLYFYYDTSVFSVDPASGFSPQGEFARTGSVMGNTIETAKANGRYRGDAGKDGAQVLWYNRMGIDTPGDGAVLTLRLKIAGDAVNGTYPVTLSCSSADTLNRKGEELSPAFVSASVTVTGGREAGETAGPGEEKPTAEFSDTAGNWAEDYIRRAAGLGLIEGYPDGTYGPGRTMTRAELVTILWRAAGAPEPRGKATFTDLPYEWYQDAIAWAEENGVVNGIGDGLFDPQGTVTREQLVTVLHRRAGCPTGMEGLFTALYDSQYPDSHQIGDWAKKALYWSIYNGIYCGENSASIGKTLAPRSAATRAQIAVMIVRCLEE